MRHHMKYTATRYEYAIENSKGERAFTLWMRQRKPTLSALCRAVTQNVDAIRTATHAQDVMWNGDGTITAGEYTGRMTGLTLLEARGYSA
jgi:hypothetical protein